MAALAPAELDGVAQLGRVRVSEELLFGGSGVVFETPALVAGLDDVAVMSVNRR